jgi:hypothetical protein
MMGRQDRDQASLFYELRLAERISESHLLCRLNGFAIRTGSRRSCSYLCARHVFNAVIPSDWLKLATRRARARFRSGAL